MLVILPFQKGVTKTCASATTSRTSHFIDGMKSRVCAYRDKRIGLGQNQIKLKKFIGTKKSC